MERRVRASQRETTTRGKVILSLNSGSSSGKLSLFRISATQEELVVEGAAENVGKRDGRIRLRDSRGKKLIDRAADFADSVEALRALFDCMNRQKMPRPDAIGHRIVHAGPDHTAPEKVTRKLIGELKKLVPLAPLHLPASLQWIDTAAALFPDTPQVVCFDTAFHRRMPEVAVRLPLPRALWDRGIRRYGFHGISYEYIMRTLGAEAPKRIIIAHLGNGASMVAVRDGKPIDTTMGFTPAGGFMMGTRTGDLDPGVLAYLQKNAQYDADAIEQLVNRQSGLLGVSGSSSDMKVLLEKRATDPAAAEAVAMFCYQARKSIGALAAALSGLDLLVFTAGIGERAPAIRAEICVGMEHLGIRVDPERNQQNADTISDRESRCVVRVIPTNEDLMIARHTYRVIFN
jgi:acetate kinase